MTDLEEGIKETEYEVDYLGRKRTIQEILRRDRDRKECCRWLWMINIILIISIMCIEWPLYKEVSILWIISTILRCLIILPIIIAFIVFGVCMIIHQCNKLI